jgi:hypothetical protein
MHSEAFVSTAITTCAPMRVTPSMPDGITNDPSSEYVHPKPIGQVQRLSYAANTTPAPSYPNISHLKLESRLLSSFLKGSELFEDSHKLIKSVDLRCQTILFFSKDIQLDQMVFWKHFMLIAPDICPVCQGKHNAFFVSFCL